MQFRSIGVSPMFDFVSIGGTQILLPPPKPERHIQLDRKGAFGGLAGGLDCQRLGNPKACGDRRHLLI
jgi:hypothetical protein